MKRLVMLLFALIMFVLNVSVNAESSTAENSAESVAVVNAVWQEHEEKMYLNSFYTYHSCDGVESKIELILEELGAKEVKARATGCFDFNSHLGKNIRVKVKFKTLTTDLNVEGEPVIASLQAVHIRPRHPRSIRVGDCEVIEDIQKSLLGSFEHEVIKKNRKCYPGQQSLGDVDWKLKVLKVSN